MPRSPTAAGPPRRAGPPPNPRAGRAWPAVSYAVAAVTERDSDSGPEEQALYHSSYDGTDFNQYEEEVFTQ